MLYLRVGYSVGMVELLVAKVKLLYPSLTTLFDAVGGVLIGDEVFGEAIEFVAEGKAVIVEAEYDAYLGICRILIYIGL